MSVLIKGMKMPETCDKCDFCTWSNYHQTGWCRNEQRQCFDDYSVEYRKKRAEFCPIAELPPHGRLIDGDRLHKQVTKFTGAPHWVAIEIKQAPTIIEAEVSE